MGFPASRSLRLPRAGANGKLTGNNANCFFNLSCHGWDPVVIHLKPGANEIALPTGPAPQEGW